MKFRINHGSHSEMVWVEASKEEVEADLPGTIKRANGKYYRHVVKTYNGQKVTRVGDQVQTTPGDVIETDRDLAKLFNGRNVPNMGGLGPKFTLLMEDSAPAKDRWSNLESLSIEELRVFARVEEIDLGDAKTKKDILEKLQQVT